MILPKMVQTKGFMLYIFHNLKKMNNVGRLVAPMVKCLPSAKVMIPGPWDCSALGPLFSGEPHSPASACRSPLLVLMMSF